MAADQAIQVAALVTALVQKAPLLGWFHRPALFTVLDWQRRRRRRRRRQ